ncbi:protein rolling stone-like [Branchiostoma floridae x Branchiostoma belcheri]
MSCTGRIKREFRLKQFLPSHSNRLDFTRTPWLSNQLPFLIYRVVLCLFQISAYLYTLLSFYTTGPKYLLYMTNLAYIVLTAHATLSAILCLVDYFGSRRRRSERGTENADDRPTVADAVPMANTTTSNRSYGTNAQQPTSSDVGLQWYYKCYWILYNIAFAVGLYVTVAFWILLRGARDAYSASSILTHGTNCVVIVIDILISGLPCRLLHFIYPSCFALVYILFTVIYWAAGGTDIINRSWIYPVLDYGGNPGLAVGVAVGSVLLAAPLCHGIVFGLAFTRDSMLMRLVNKRHLPNGEGIASEHQADQRV